MDAVILGTIHRFQRNAYSGQFHTTIEQLVEAYHLQCVCEEMNADERVKQPYAVVAPFVEKILGIKHLDMDMSYGEQSAAGLPLPHESDSNRGTVFKDEKGVRAVFVHYHPFDVRENRWIDRIEELGMERVLVICAFPHPEPFCEKWLARGHTILAKCVHVHQNTIIALSSYAVTTEVIPDSPPFVRVEKARILQSDVNDFDQWHREYPKLLAFKPSNQFSAR